MVLLFAYLIVVPIVTLLHDAVEVQFGDARRTKSELGDWTLYYLTRALSSPVASRSVLGTAEKHSERRHRRDL